MGGQVAGDFSTVFAVALHPQVQRLQTAQNEEAIHRSGHCTARILEGAKGIGPLCVRRDQAPHDHIRVAAEVLRHTVHDHVRAQVERVLKHGRGKGVVHHHPGIGAFHQVGHSGDVGDLHHRVGQGFHPHQTGVLVQCRLNGVEVAKSTK